MGSGIAFERGIEPNSKGVVDSLNSNKLDESAFCAITEDCKYFFSPFFTNSNVEFIRRQVNEVVHNLVRVAMSLVSLHIFTDIPTSIQNLIVNEML